MPCPVDSVLREGGAWRIATPLGPIHAESLVIATGGLTVPKIGATPFGYRVAEQFGLAVVPPSPALVPLALPPEALAQWGDLAGVSVDVEVTCGAGRFRENLLFTHRGLSGPAILQISTYWNGGAPLVHRRAPGIERGRVAHRRARVDASASTRSSRERLPQRFAQRWCGVLGVTAADPTDARKAAARDRRRAACVVAASVRDARLQQGRGHARRRRHARAVEPVDDGDAASRDFSSLAKSSM